jgi:hypothetical protein
VTRKHGSVWCRVLDENGNPLPHTEIVWVDGARAVAQTVLPELIQEEGLSFHVWDPEKLNDHIARV